MEQREQHEMQRKPYRIKLFLADRLLWILIYYFSLTIVTLAIELDVIQHSSGLRMSTVLYIYVLATVQLGIGLVIEYIRQRAFFSQLSSILGDRQPDPDAAVHIHSAVTHEQDMFREAYQMQHRSYMDELYDYRRKQEQHRHFSQQWVHYMKTPVSVIHLLTQQAAHANTAEEARELLLSVQEENERIERGLELMLHTARLDKFEMDLHIRRISLMELARRIVNGHKKACIRWSIYPKIIGEDVQVETDEKWMAFVLNQIITNAIKYSKDREGGKQLLIYLKQSDHEASISVSDEGIGVARQDVGRVFDPFFTGENGRLVEESTGMGLYLAKQVCGRLGHKISIVSELGIGTTLTIRFAPNSIHRLE